MQVDFHPPFFHDIHHIEGHDHRLPQFQQLEGQIQAPFQGGSIHYVDDHIHFIAEDEVPGDDFFHGVGGEAVGAGQVHQMDVHVVAPDGPFHLFHRDPGPVGHLQVGPGKGIEQGGLPAVGIADEADGEILGIVEMLFRLLLSHGPPPPYPP